MPEQERGQWGTERWRPAPVTLPRPSRLIGDAYAILGELTGLGTTYTEVGQAKSFDWRVNLRLTNRTAGIIKVRLYRADSSWTSASGEPTAGTLKTAWAYDMQVGPGIVVNLEGYMLLNGERVVARSDTASSLDLQVDGQRMVKTT